MQVLNLFVKLRKNNRNTAEVLVKGGCTWTYCVCLGNNLMLLEAGWVMIAHIQEELCSGLCHWSLLSNPGAAKSGAQLGLSAGPPGGFWAVLWQPRLLLCAWCAVQVRGHQRDSTERGDRFWLNPLCCGGFAPSDRVTSQSIGISCWEMKIIFCMFQVGLWNIPVLLGRINLPTWKQIILQSFEKD